MDNVNRNIKFLRKKNGLTQDDLAKKTGVKRSQIGSYEEGRAVPKLNLLQFMANYFGLTIDDLVNKALWNREEISPSNRFAENTNNLRILTTVVNESNEERFALVPQKATAGYTTGYADPDYVEKLPIFDLPLPEFKNGGTYRVFQISGESMEPVPSGAYIIGEFLSGINDIAYGEPHILVTQTDGIVYKRIEQEADNEEKLLLKSDNPEFKAYTVNLKDVHELWKAVGFISTQLPHSADISRNKIQHLISDLRDELDAYGSR